MKIYIENLPEKLNKGMEIFCKKYDVELRADGIKLEVEMSATDEIGFRENKLYYKSETDIFRLLVKWLYNYKNNIPLSLNEKKRFDTFGIMLDFSRNEIMHLKGIKEYITYVAAFGVDRIFLYLEDTYEVKDYPYMGYFRGRYAAEELREIDEFAAGFGIEIVGCVQTLGHMDQFLRWHKELRDNNAVLLANNEDTYIYIEKCLKTIAENISSSYIHVGMDETVGLGRGRYEKLFGPNDAGKVFVNHLIKVCEICKKLGKKPMIWGDMLVALSSDIGSYMDENAEIRKDLTEMLPDVDIVYWDYYNVSQKHYEIFLDMFKETGKEIWFAGGIWTWHTFTYGDERTKKTTKPAIKACLNKGIRNVFATSWANPGGFCPLMGGLYGVAVWAKEIYESNTGDSYDEFKIVTGENGEDFAFINNLDSPKILKQQDLNVSDQIPSTAVSSFLFQSILCGLFDTVTDGHDLTTYYAECAEEISKVKTENFSELFKYYEALARALSLKANLGNILLKAYRENDREALSKTANERIPKLIECLIEVIDTHRALWNRYNKPYGFDVVRDHYASVIADCYDTCATVNEYLSGKIETIDQLEQQRLDYKHNWSHNDTGFVSDTDINATHTVSRILG